MSAKYEEIKSKAGKWSKRIAWILLVLGILSAIVYYVVRTYSVSDGVRTGLLYKLSHKGVVFKTYEGELHLGGSIQMNAQSVWYFSVKNEEIFKKMQAYDGKNVKLHYHELVNAFPWQGDTNYIVDDVQPVQ